MSSILLFVLLNLLPYILFSVLLLFPLIFLNPLSIQVW